MISKELVNALCCPTCKSELRITDSVSICTHCGKYYFIVNGIPRFTPSDSYVGSFSFEWDKHRNHLLDSVSGLTRAEDMFFERTGLDRQELKGKLVLDAGCGTGRFSEVVMKYGGHVVGVDMSCSVEEAVENVPGAEVLQADIMNLPFRKESFDIVFSLGVIHHTYNTSKAFGELAKLVKPGGKLSVWVYSDEGWKTRIHNRTQVSLCRAITTKMPPEMLYKLCHVAIPLYYIHKLPIIGLLSRALLTSSCEPIPEWRLLDTFDWYSPKYQFKHTYREVDEWFYGLGFEDVTNLKVAVSAKGTKSVAAKNG